MLHKHQHPRTLVTVQAAPARRAATASVHSLASSLLPLAAPAHRLRMLQEDPPTIRIPRTPLHVPLLLLSEGGDAANDEARADEGTPAHLPRGTHREGDTCQPRCAEERTQQMRATPPTRHVAHIHATCQPRGGRREGIRMRAPPPTCR